MKRKNIPDIDADFLLLPWQGGIRLEKPTARKNETLVALRNFFKFPFNIYFFSLQNIFVCMNEENAFRNGHLSANEVIGKPISSFFTDKSIDALTRYHQQVLSSRQLQLKEETFISLQLRTLPSCLSFKFPWYDENGLLCGIFGYSIMPEVHNLSTSLSTLIQVGLLTNNPTNPTLLLPGKQVAQHYLSKRELDCLTLLARGQTAKMAGQQLGLSFRTVESYIENVKCKLNVYSKAELCAKAMEFGLLSSATFDRPS
jgi:DNA-binding CsgD family transcriptional regulator